MKKYKNYSLLNEFKFRFREKETGKFSYAIESIHREPHMAIKEYREDLSKMCLIGVSNKTHELVEVKHLFDNSIIYEHYE